MNQVDLIRLLQHLARDYKKRTFSLRELATLARISRPATGMLLLRAQTKGIVFRVGTLWVNQMDPPSLSEIAFALSSPSYLSFESALYHHGVLSQSPRGALTVACTGRPHRIRTPLGEIRFVHLKPSLFFGFDSQRIAYPEKAWLDLLYIRGLKGRKDLISETLYLDRLNTRRLAAFEKRFPAWVSTLRRSF